MPGGPELIKQLKEYKVDVMDQCQQSQDELHVIMEVSIGIFEFSAPYYIIVDQENWKANVRFQH